MSGEEAFSILNKIFIAKNSEPIEKIKGYTIKYGNIIQGEEIIDEVLVSYFKAPKSYTTENMCEINSHGGNVLMQRILDLCIKNGAELAKPGEFTKRAFINGRIDLVQAESVIDIINAKTLRESKEVVKQLEGYLSEKISNIKQNILSIMTNIEVSIDYPEYDTPVIMIEDIKKCIDEAEKQLSNLETTFDNGKILRNGIKTAIIGKPNSGKSSLLNAILKEERAIVTEYEGTTRDTIEEFINLNGIPLNIIDTAGLRRTEDAIEKIGIQKSKKLAKDADLVICIIDSSKALDVEDYEIFDNLNEQNTIIVLNKIDLEMKIDENNEKIQKFKNIVKISALKKQGIEDLCFKIEDMFKLGEVNYDDTLIITNERHKNLIRVAIKNLQEARKSVEDNMPIDIIAISLKNVLSNLGEITGEEVSEEIINEIFSRFCLGK